MFTGLVEDVGEVVSLARSVAGARVVVRTSLQGDLGIGASLAVDGCCLTITAGDLSPAGHPAKPGWPPPPGSLLASRAAGTLTPAVARDYAFDASAETLERTTLGRRKAGDRVNLERPLTLATRLGGHLVLGHVDGVGRVEERTPVGAAERWRFSMPEALAPLVAEKGSIAVDGVSLTVNSVGPRQFSVMLIPETLRKTVFGDKRAGDAVNLETDIVAKHVARLMAAGREASPSLSALLGLPGEKS